MRRQREVIHGCTLSLVFLSFLSLFACVSCERNSPRSLAGAAVRSNQGVVIPELLLSVVDHYRSLRSYRDVMFISTEAETSTTNVYLYQEGVSFSFQQPNQIAYISEVESLWCDGHTRWDAVRMMRQYSVQRCESRIDTSSIRPATAFGHLTQHLISVLITNPDRDLRDMLPSIVGIREVEAASCCMPSTHAWEFEIPDDKYHSGSNCLLRICVDEKSMLITEMELDMTAAYKAQPRSDGMWPEVQRLVAKMTFAYPQVDVPIAVDDFTFVPFDDDVRVENIIRERGTPSR